MSDHMIKVEAARAEAAIAKARLTSTLARVQDKLSPASIADTALQTAKDRGAQAIEDATAFAREKPAATSAIAALGIALVFRGPLVRLSRRLFSSKRATGDEDGGFNI